MIGSTLQHATCHDYPVIQYADDTILVIPASEIQLSHIKKLLPHYATYTGLKVNYSKSIMILISTPDSKMQILSDLLGC